ncbi:virion RNA polymerase [Acinetobacter phage Presley]|uniref:Virion assoviated RNA polymerase n=1 Tax=Acinetobacter phage Presley TaxID=1406780 RepID=U5PWL7_9CAUD|nr:virion RNA polymerase [Acinetobacter phage Presley]AGY48146.1 virion assoviated RNA polymerase [Acinetobacter phage Presley]
MAKYKSVFDVGSKQTSVMEALGRISSELAPKVVSASIEQSPIAANRPESYDPVAEQYASLQDYINAGGIPSRATKEFYNDVSIAALQPQVDQYHKRKEETGLLSYNNLTSSNPIKSGAANLLNWTAQAGAHLAELGLNAYAGNQLSDVRRDYAGVPDNVIAAYQKQLAGGQLSQEEQNLLQGSNPYAIKGFWDFSAPKTYKEVLDNARQKETEAYATIGNKKAGIPNRLDTQSWYNHLNEENYQQSLGDLAQAKTDWETAKSQWESGEYGSAILSALSATTDTASNVAHAIKENPAYLGDLMATTAPYLIQRTMGGTMALDAQRLENDNRRNFQQRTGEINPSTGEELAMTGATAGYSALNFVENAMALRALKGTVPSTGLAEALGMGTIGKVASPVTHIAKTAAVEGATEFAQNQIENSWGNLSTDFDLVDNVEAGVLGAAMGAGFAAPGSVIQAGHIATDAIGSTMQQRAANKVGSADQSLEDLSNPESPSYAPDKAINRILATDLPNSSPENLSAIKEQTDAIYNEAQNQYNVVDQNIRDAENLPDLQAKYEQFKAKAEENRAKFADNPEMLAKVEELIAQKDELLQSQLTRAQDISNDMDTYIARRDELKATLDRTQENYDAFNSYYQNLQPENSVQRTEADEILQAPSISQAKRIQELMADENVPEATRSTLRVVNDAIIAQNQMKDLGIVNNDVTKGGVGYRGLAQYMDFMGKAIQRNEPTRQESLLRDISNFEFTQSGKLDALQQAQEAANNLNVRIQVTRNTDGTWNVHDNEQISNDIFKKNQGVLVHPMKADGTGGSQRLINSLAAEVEGIKATNLAMQEMVKYSKQSQEQTTTEQPVQDTVSVDPFTDAMDALNNFERTNGRDTAARERSNSKRVLGMADPNVITDVTGENFNEVRDQALKRASDIRQQEYEQLVNNTKTAPVSEQSVSEATDTAVQAEPSTQTTQPEAAIESDANTAVSPKTTIAVEGAISPLVNSSVESVKAEKTKPARQQNLVLSGFTQRVRNGLNSPLVMATNFRSNYLKPENYKAIAERLAGIQLTEKQAQTLDTFNRVAESQYPVIKDIVATQKNADYRHTAFNDFLLNEQGELDENTATAISAAAFSWLGENGGKTRDTPQDVIKKLGLSDIDELPPHVFNRLTSIGVHRATLAASLGQRIYQSLGFKMFDDVDPKRQSKLEMALGHTAIAALLKDNLLEQDSITAQEMKELRNDVIRNNESAKDEGDVDYSGTSYFIRPKMTMTDGDLAPTPRVNQIREATKESGSILSKVFGFTPDRSLPTSEPVTEVIQEFNSQGSKVPDMAKEVILKMQSTPYEFNTDMTRIMDKLVDNHGDKLKEMFGYVPADELANKHVYFRDSQKAVNEAIERSLDIAFDARKAVNDGQFYLAQNMWNNQRSGYESAFNLQADKVHRSIASLVEDRIEVPLNEMPFNDKGELTQYGEFLRALSFRMEEAVDKMDFEGKTADTVDKVQLENFIPYFDNYINSPRVVTATEAMLRLRNHDDVNPADLDTVIDMVKEFGMGGLSLSALNTLASMLEAKQRGDKSFTAALPGESDGVTNGYALTQVMLNTANNEGYKSVGIFPDSEITNVPQYRERGGLNGGKGRDVYQQLGDLQKGIWKEEVRDDSPRGRAVRSLDYIDTAYGKRGGAKRAATPFNYGSGNASVNRASARGTLKAFYQKLENSYNSPDKDKNLNSDKAAINAILTYAQEIGYDVPLVKDFGNVLDFTLSREQEAAFMAADIALHGEATTEALKALAGPFIQSRDRKTLLATTAFEVYDSVLEHMINEATEKARSEGKLLEVKGKAIEGLSAKELKAIQRKANKFMPSLATPMGIESGQASTSSIPLMKQEVKWDRSPMYEMQLKYNGVQSMRTGVREYRYVDPGVSGLALYIQSHDAYITFRTMKDHAVQNFHDANAGNAYQLNAIARTQNEAFLDAVTISHAGKAFTTALLKPFKGIVDTKLPLSKEMKLRLRNSAVGLARSYNLKLNAPYAEVFSHVVEQEFNADIAKMERIIQQEYINQYGTEGGEYKITDEKRTELNKRLESLKRAKAKAVEQAKQIGSDLGNYLKGTSEIIDKEVPKPIAPQPSKTVMGAILMESPIKGPADLVQRVKQELKDYTHQGGNTGRYASLYSSLLDIALPSIPKNLDIQTYQSFEQVPVETRGLIEAREQGTNAWFITGDKPQLILVSDGSLNTGIFVHEIMHAATANAIREIQKNPNKYPKAQESLDKLTRLYEHVKSKTTDSSPEIVKYGTQNLDEFIATGLTDPRFINHLDSIVDVPKEARGMNKLLTAFRGLVSGILDALYAVAGKNRKYNPKELTAYEALILDSVEFIGRTQDISNTKQMDILGAPKTAANAQVSNYTAKEVFDAIDDGKLNSEFKAHLSELMTNVTDKLMNESSTTFLRSKNAYSPDALWDKALKSGKAPYTTAALTAGFNLTAQEQFAIEALEVATNAVIKDKSLTPVFREIQRIYDKARNDLKPENFHPGDWSVASPAQKKAAEAKYEHVFGIYSKGDHFAKFMAMALGSQEVNSLLNFGLEKERIGKQTPFDKLLAAIDTVVNTAYGFLTRTQLEHTADKKLPILAEQLVDIDLKNRNKALTVVEKAIDAAEEISNKVTTKSRAKITKILAKSPTANSKNKYVKIAHNMARTSAAAGNVFGIMDVLKEFRESEKPNERLGFGGELLNEIASTNPSQAVAQKLLNTAKQNETMRKRISDVVKHDLLSMFDNQGKDLNREQRKAITYGALRTDMQSLLNHFDVSGINTLVKDNVALSREIKKAESSIKDVMKINRAKDLAWYMVSGEAANMLAKNAELIAMDGGFIANTKPSPKLVEQIDKLVSLYAISYLNTSDRTALSEVMDKELARGKDNGIESLLKLHQSMVIDSRDALFAGNPLSMVKGYLPEITNSNRELVVARTSAERDRYESAYYKKISDLQKDPLDPDTNPATLYFSEDAGHQRYVSGAIALNNYGRKGQEVQMTPQELANARNAVRSRMSRDPNYDPRKKDSRHMVPNYDTDGNIMGFSYEMTHQVRDSFLERNNDFSDILGAFAATGYDKLTTAEQNNIVIETLHQDFLENYAKAPLSYLRIEPYSKDPVIAQAWAMMPQQTRDHIKAVTGENALYVKNDVFLTVFGARKLSITNAFDKEPDFRNVGEKAVVAVMGTLTELFGGNSRTKAATAERVWMKAVQLMKSFVVIRNVSTMVGNIVTNTFLLMAHGVSPSTLIKDTVTSVKGGIQYRKDMAELIKLQARQRANIGNANELQKEIDRIQDSLDRNPLKGFIEEGMLSGIVEDIDPSANMYSYKSGMERKYEDVIDKVPQTVRTAAKWLFVSPGTPHYQFLHSATQFSDFSAKYVLYKHATTRKRDRLSHDEAIQLASDNFINYDVPTSAGMQYLNDVGLLMFTKYNLRIQKALFQLIGKRPASAIGQAILLNAISNLPPGIDPIVFNQWGNPLRSGPFGLSGSWDEPFPIQALKTLF